MTETNRTTAPPAEEPTFEGKPLSYWIAWRADQQRYLDAAIAKGTKSAITRWSRGVNWITPHIEEMQS